MLFTIDPVTRSAAVVEPESFSGLKVRERFDFQEWVLATPQLVGEDLLVVTSEFAGFDRTAERLDVLALDRAGTLVVVELKRTAVGTYADLQALRYAAYCSTLTLDDVAELLAAHKSRREGRECSVAEAAEEIGSFVEDPDFEDLDDKPRIILAAEEFPPEMTATLLWLRSFDLDISAVRLRPYKLGERILLDSQVLIPLPEAKDYVIRREKKEVHEAQRIRGKGNAYRVWFQPLIDELREQHEFTNARVAQPQNWYAFSSGTRGVIYSVSFAKAGLRTEVYIDMGTKEENKSLFDRLAENREALERDFGGPLEWERLENRRACRVFAHNGTAIDASEEDLQRAREWAVENILKLKRVFGPRLLKITQEAEQQTGSAFASSGSNGG